MCFAVFCVAGIEKDFSDICAYFCFLKLLPRGCVWIAWSKGQGFGVGKKENKVLWNMGRRMACKSKQALATWPEPLSEMQGVSKRGALNKDHEAQLASVGQPPSPPMEAGATKGLHERQLTWVSMVGWWCTVGTTPSTRLVRSVNACHQPFRAEKTNTYFRNGALSCFPGWKWSPNLTLQRNSFCLSQILVVWLVYGNIFLPTLAAQQSELQRLISFSDQMTGLTVDEL